ncbi:MAG: FAD-binding oxidoreductase, partial [Algiphilus sp.]
MTLSERLLSALGECLPAERWTTAMAERVAYSYDNSRLHGLPDAVVFATCHEDVLAVMGLAHTHGIPVVARGRGTNTVGSTVPTAGGIALSLERMTRILDYQPDDRLLICEAGTLNSSVQARATEDGLFWAPDPTSAAYSTVGGNIACGAGGPRAVKYGTARDAVLGLRAVDGTGRSLRTGCRTNKGVVGYDLTRLLVGSEGTLAVVTEATLRLLPQAEQKRTMRAAYASVDGAVAAVARIMRQPAIPCAVEFMDDEAVRLARAHSALDLPEQTRALLLLEVDGAASSIAHDVEAIATAASGKELLDWQSAASAEDSASLWAAR